MFLHHEYLCTDTEYGYSVQIHRCRIHDECYCHYRTYRHKSRVQYTNARVANQNTPLAIMYEAAQESSLRRR